MRYLGGKSRLAKRIAQPINEVLCGRPLWEPFCGGLGMSAAWDHPEFLLLSDACPPLINMYQALDVGWEPGWAVADCTREEHFAVIESLSPDDPLLGFMGFARSWAGIWCSFVAQPGLALQTYKSLAKTYERLGPHAFELIDFCSVEPFPYDGVIYCDPPYIGTEGYPGAPPFDHERFYDRVLEWAGMGADVFVSEFEMPADVGTCILELPRTQRANQHAAEHVARVDRLYWVEP